MASNTRLISSGVTYYLAGGGLAQIPYAGSATPWTLQSTTPFELSLNDVTPIWTPAPAPSTPILGGGPPFRLGRSLIAKSYDTVTEQVGIQLRATSPDNATALLRMLRQILNTTLYDSPCILAVQPDGFTNTTYFEILYADVPELPSYLTENATGAAVFRATITWVRTIGSAGALTTLINALTIENRSSGSPDNVESLGALTGDLINEGQPLNLKLAVGASVNRLHMAIVYERINTSVVNSQTTTFTPLTGFAVFTQADVTVTNVRNRGGLKIRILARLDTFTNPNKIRLRCQIFNSTGLFTIKNTAVVALPATGAVSTLVDFGFIDARSILSVHDSTAAIRIVVNLMSSDGTSVTARLDYVETLLYYTFATVDDANTGTPSQSIIVEQANDYNPNGIVVPSAPARVYRIGTAEWRGNLVWRGTLPRAYSGASLWLAWLTATSVANDTHTTTQTVTATVTHLPLAHTVR